MMEKFIYYNELYLIYKDLLNSKMQKVFDLYYGDNYTMQEIAELIGISKARVGIIIKNVQKKLEEYEDALKIYKNNNNLKEILELNDIVKIKKEIKKIIEGEI